MAKFVILVFVVAVLAIIATSIISYGGVNNFIRAVRLATYAGRLTIGAEAPTITWVRMDAPGSDTTCTITAGDCGTDPEENGYHDPELRVRVRDGNGNCDSVAFEVYIYLCDPGGTLDCSAGNARTGMPVQLSLDFKDPGDSAYCEYIWPSGTNEMEYWEAPGNSYELYVRATDDAGTTWNSDDPVRRYWEYTSLPSLMYPIYDDAGGGGGYIDYGTLSLGIYNKGIGCEAAGVPDPTCPENDVETKNGGNVVTQVQWRATDFNDGGTNYIEINTGPDTFYLDDDQLMTGDAGDTDGADFDQLAFADTPDNTNYGAFVTWPSAAEGYLDVCGDYTCDTATYPSAHFDIYYHLFIDSGQAVGTYTNSIDIIWS